MFSDLYEPFNYVVTLDEQKLATYYEIKYSFIAMCHIISMYNYLHNLVTHGSTLFTCL